jgi:3-hydroxyisobutyrate dehydrogenase-like beta-hydroxyacid dehydrogenase
MIGKVGFIGFGEVGQHFARDLKKAGVSEIFAYDIQQGAEALPRKRAAEVGISLVGSVEEAVVGAKLAICCVTAGADMAAAKSAVPFLGEHPYWLDVNSVSPGTKRECAAVVEAGGGRFVEAAVMTSVPPHGLASPMLLGGPHANAFMAFAEPLPMKLTFMDERIGVASAVKMCRSVMIKGIEALTTESMLAARHYGVEKEVLASLGDTIPHPDWPKLARYVMSRALIHGRRRAEEMREVARTVSEAGIEPLLAAPTAERQDWAADRGRELGERMLKDASLEELLDSMLSRLRDEAKAAE